MQSIWEIQNGISDRKTIRTSASGEIHRQAVVIGAGMAGVLTAYRLKEKGIDVLLVDADRVAGGQTGRTTAKITSQHGLKYSRLIRMVGREKAALYAGANEAAINEFERVIKKEGIDCGFERMPAYLYTLENADLLRAEAEAASSLGINAYFTTETELPFDISGAVCFEDQAQFEPLKFINHIAEGLDICENTKIIDIDIRNRKIKTKLGSITTDDIVVATHYPIFNVPGFYFIRQHQERSYVTAFDGCKRLNGMYYGIDEGGMSLRSDGDVLLIGGGGHRTGENTEGGSYRTIELFAERYFPDGEMITRWSAQDCMPHDSIPFIGRYSCMTKHLYVATGFQKWGMTSSMISAMIISDMLCGKDNVYERVFSPQRLNVRAGAGSLISDIGHSVKGLVKGLFAAEIGTEKRFSGRCSHMGCKLTWNPDEESWDCPCHGSRFDRDGKLLDDPARRSLKER